VQAGERNARVVPLEPDSVARRVEVEPEAVAPGLLRSVAARSNHLGEQPRRDDPSGEQSVPKALRSAAVE